MNFCPSMPVTLRLSNIWCLLSSDDCLFALLWEHPTQMFEEAQIQRHASSALLVLHWAVNHRPGVKVLSLLRIQALTLEFSLVRYLVWLCVWGNLRQRPLVRVIHPQRQEESLIVPFTHNPVVDQKKFLPDTKSKNEFAIVVLYLHSELLFHCIINQKWTGLLLYLSKLFFKWIDFERKNKKIKNNIPSLLHCRAVYDTKTNFKNILFAKWS